MTKRTVELELATTGVDSQGRAARIPLTAKIDQDTGEPDLGGEHLLVNIGPQHPATHGVLRLVVGPDGETVVPCIPHAGYLPSGFEKFGEIPPDKPIIPPVDPTAYLSANV